MKQSIEVIHNESNRVISIECEKSDNVDTLKVSMESFTEQCDNQGISFELKYSNGSTLAEKLLFDQFSVNSTFIALRVGEVMFGCTLQPKHYLGGWKLDECEERWYTTLLG